MKTRTAQRANRRLRSMVACSAALLASACIAACGSSGGNSASVSASSSSSTTQVPTSTSEATTRTTSSTTRSSSSSSTESGATTGQAPAGVAKGGDESIQRYGHEGSAADKAAIESVVKSYYAAVASGNHSQACAQLSSAFKQGMTRGIARAGPIKAKGCAAILSVLLRTPTGKEAAQLKIVEVTGVRLKGNKAFALIRTPTIHSGELLVSREADGAWKVSSLIGSELPS